MFGAPVGDDTIGDFAAHLHTALSCDLAPSNNDLRSGTPFTAAPSDRNDEHR